MTSINISQSISLISFQWIVEIGWCTVLASCNIIIYLVIAVDSWQKVVEDFCRYDSFRNDARSKSTQHCRRIQYVNSLWPSGVTWWHRSWSTLAQVMTCCLMAPSHNLNKCWLLISEGFFFAFTWESFRRDYYCVWIWKLYFWNHCHISWGPMCYPFGVDTSGSFY